MKNLLAFVFSVAMLTIACAPAVHATTPTSFSIESVGSSIGLGNADLKETTLNILRLALSFLTLVALVMIIFGFAFNYLGSGQSDVVRDRAQKVLMSGIIGLIVVLLAWAIVLFVARTTANVTSNT